MEDVVRPDGADIRCGRIVDHQGSAGTNEIHERLRRELRVPGAGPCVVLPGRHPAGLRAVGGNVAGRDGDADETMGESFEILPERVDAGIHEADVRQADGIHSVGHVRDAQPAEQLEHARIVRGREERRLHIGAAAACVRRINLGPASLR